MLLLEKAQLLAQCVHGCLEFTYVGVALIDQSGLDGDGLPQFRR